MKNHILLGLIVLAFSCKKEDTKSCYEEVLDQFKLETDAIKIDKYLFENENAYLMDDGAPAYDGISYLIDEKCDTICQIGGFNIQLPCVEKLKFVEVVWKK